MSRLLWPILVLSLCACAGPEGAPPPVGTPVLVGDLTDEQGEFYSPLLSQRTIYTLGVGDVIQVSILDLEEEGELLELEVEVAEDGRVPLPVLGPVRAAERTADELRMDLVKALSERFLDNPFVSVKVKEYKSRRIAVLGTVLKPGIHFLPRPEVSVNEALGLAGGLTERSGLRAVVVHGGEHVSQREIDPDALSRGDVTQNVFLQHGDVLHVLAPEQFHVAGFVQQPGEFEFRHEMSVRKAIAMAGGIRIPDASPDMTRIRRRGPQGEYFVSIDLNGILDEDVPDVQILAGDVLEVRQSTFRYLVVGTYDAVQGLISVGVNAASLF